jgi:hypothetical protein
MNMQEWFQLYIPEFAPQKMDAAEDEEITYQSELSAAATGIMWQQGCLLGEAMIKAQIIVARPRPRRNGL